MKLHADAGATRITSYGAGYFAIGERIVRHGIIISADGTVTPWPPVVPDDLDEEHLRQIVAHDPEVVLLGTGVRQAFPAPELLLPFVEAGLGVEVMDTAAALPDVQRARGGEPRGGGGPPSHRIGGRRLTPPGGPGPAPPP